MDVLDLLVPPPKLSLGAENRATLVVWFLIVVAPLVSRAMTPGGTWASVGVAHRFLSAGSVVVGPGPSCAEECGIFLQQG